MATQPRYSDPLARIALCAHRQDGLDGAWWPRSHLLSDELPNLVASWPTANGQIAQVLYSPPDWDDRPATVPIGGGGAPLRTGNITRDAPRIVLLVMLDGTRWSLAVIPPRTEADIAARQLDEFAVGS